MSRPNILLKKKLTKVMKFHQYHRKKVDQDTFANNSVYKRTLALLLGEANVENFLKSDFEANPVHFTCTEGTHQPNLEAIFSKEALLNVTSTRSLQINTNVNIVRYNGKEKKAMTVSRAEPLTTPIIQSCFKKGYSVQFFQPQRFSDALYVIVAGFEYHFGALAGCSAYLTPPHTQGLAPHHDDVEVFILQLEGSKLWKLWPGDMLLPEIYSDDITREALSSRPCKEVLLNAGDVLYLPRGTIHEAIALETFSTHVTISVYQKYNIKALLNSVLPKVLESAFDQSLALRRGLPNRLAESFGSFSASREVVVVTHPSANGITNSACRTGTSSVQASLQDTNAAFIDTVVSSSINDSQELPTPYPRDGSALRTFLHLQLQDAVKSLSSHLTLAHVDEAVDEMMGDFVTHRLPPPDLIATDLLTGKCDAVSGRHEEPVQAHLEAWQGSKVAKKQVRSLCPSSLVRICDPGNMFCMEKVVDGVKLLVLSHSRFNSRLRHMGHPIDVVGDDSEVDDDDDANSDDDEEGERGGDEEHEDYDDEASDDMDADSPWLLHLPTRLSPVIAVLQEAYTGGGIILSVLMERLQLQFQISPQEVGEAVANLCLAGFIEAVSNGSISRASLQQHDSISSIPTQQSNSLEDRKKRELKTKSSTSMVAVGKESLKKRVRSEGGAFSETSSAAAGKMTRLEYQPVSLNSKSAALGGAGAGSGVYVAEQHPSNDRERIKTKKRVKLRAHKTRS